MTNTIKYLSEKDFEEIVKFLIVMTGKFPDHHPTYIIEKFHAGYIGLDTENNEQLKKYYDKWVF